MGYSVWFCDLEKAIKALRAKVPNLETFNSIEGNAFGDFIVKTDTEKWLIRYTDFSVWHEEKGKHKWGDWVEL